MWVESLVQLISIKQSEEIRSVSITFCYQIIANTLSMEIATSHSFPIVSPFGPLVPL